jgi:hypothetical protein
MEARTKYRLPQKFLIRWVPLIAGREGRARRGEVVNGRRIVMKYKTARIPSGFGPSPLRVSGWRPNLYVEGLMGKPVSEVG